ncbi:MFS transporter [Nonomuraea sp. NPDC050540]|uniref:MFS transporter n=1 Tax=Nonomuraea sp. NPDC050540 TaxID=3364367 RepID=UPI0037B2A34E
MATTEKVPSLFSHQAFRRVFMAAAASLVGVEIAFVALPLVAISALNASPGQVAVIGVLDTMAFLLIGLPAGAWLDRTRRRWVMVVADLGRALLMASIPVAWLMGVLTIWQLFAVALLTGVGRVFFDVASLSYLPTAVGRERLVQANSYLQSWDAGATVAGPSLGGFLVQLAAAPIAIAVTATTYLWSALCLFGIRVKEPEPERRADRHLAREVGEGVSFVLRHRLLRPIALQGAVTNLFLMVGIISIPLVFTRLLHLNAGDIGIFFTFGGVGILIGSSMARRVADRIGYGPSLWLAGLAGAPLCLLVPLVQRGVWQWVTYVCWLAVTLRIGMNNVVLVSFRQRITPDRLLGRMNATMRFLMTGSLALGAGVAGLVGQFAGVRAALWVSVIGLTVAWLPVYFSPLRWMRELPSEEEGSDVRSDD